MLIALSLPWSTSLVGIFIVIWLIAVAPTIESRAFLTSLKRPICALPIALFALAVVGTLWSDAPWGTRIYAIAADRQTADVAVAVLSFPALAARHVGLHGLPGFLHAADGDVVDRCV